MKTVNDLRIAGFTLTAAEGLVDCTRLTFPEQFYYFNPKFCRSEYEVVNGLKAADESKDGKFELIIAGNYHSGPGTLEFPFAVISARARNDIVTYFEGLVQAEEDVSRRRANLIAAIKENV